MADEDVRAPKQGQNNKGVIWTRNLANGITAELMKLHELTGADYSKQVERIAHRREFHLLEGEKGIYTVGGEKSDDYQNLLIAARKAVEFGYKVYMLPNPTETRTPDFILFKKGVYRTYDLKTVFGKGSVGTNLIDSIGQCNRILLNILVDYNTRCLAIDIKKYFEVNHKAVEVLIFKGGRHFSIKHITASRPDYLTLFRKLYER